MKNKILLRVAAVTALFLAIGAGSQLKAQCGGYVLKNTSLCEAIVTYTYTCGNGVICSSNSSGISLLENGGSFNVPPCNNCAGGCTLAVTIIKSGTMTVSPPVTVSNASPTAIYTSPCSGAHSMNLVPGAVIIN